MPTLSGTAFLYLAVAIQYLPRSFATIVLTVVDVGQEGRAAQLELLLG